MDSDNEVPDNWEDEAEKVTPEELISWNKEPVYNFTQDSNQYIVPTLSSSLLNQDLQVSQHYSNIKDPKDLVKKKDPKEPKEVKIEEPIEKLNKKLLISQITGSEFVENPKKPLNVVLIGHVDAGKSTLCGNLMLRMKKIDPRVVETFEAEAKENGRESWWLAYIMDVIEEEREKGITIEVGRAFLDTQDRVICFLDAPGHRSYVPNMVVAAAQADVAALVISARTGEFEAGFTKGGQTIEHILLCRGMGIDQFIVLVNKMDTVDWSQERFLFIKNKLSEFLFETCKLEPDQLAWIPVSGLVGNNLITLTESWYIGPAFLELLNSTNTTKSLFDAPLRVPIMDKSKENGILLLGKVETGVVVKGMQVWAVPGNVVLEIVEILGVEDQRIMYATPGMNVRIKVKGAEDVKIGAVLCDPYDLPAVSDVFVADVWIVELSAHNPLCLPGYSCIIHLGVFTSECVIEEVLCKIDKVHKRKLKSGFLKSGEFGTLKIRLKHSQCLSRFDEIKALGRFVLRNEDLTIGLGKIIQIC